MPPSYASIPTFATMSFTSLVQKASADALHRLQPLWSRASLSSASASTNTSMELTPVAKREPTWTIESAFFMTEGLSGEIVAIIAGFLDGKSLSRLQQTSRMWRSRILHLEAQLWTTLTVRELHGKMPPVGVQPVVHYLTTYKQLVDRERRHVTHIRAPSAALEAYCRAEPDHGIVGLFCDVCYFDDPRMGDAIARQRFGAMAMVIVQRPHHVQRFRKQSQYVGPINFVPLENPHWPEIPLPKVPLDTPGFLGYAFDLVRMVPGYDHLKSTVVRAILKDIRVFATAADALAAQATMPGPVVSLDNAAEDPYELCFASTVRQSLAKVSMSLKPSCLDQIVERTQHSMAYVQYGR
ncbi:hypothetical protein AeRB84_001459 [Aphanomyces euteiches]|nr:hypothetical protein AeRB84_001459 [Aphanomyces euteiches]